MPPRRSTHRSPARFLGRVIEGAKPAPFPGFVEPCCPTLRKTPPSGDGWLHEIKHDGYRAQAQFSEATRASSRGAATTGRRACRRSPPRQRAAGQQRDPRWRAGGGRRQGQARLLRAADGGVAKPTRVKARLIYYAFDLLYLDGFDLRGAALIERKRVLEALLDNARGLQLDQVRRSHRW